MCRTCYTLVRMHTTQLNVRLSAPYRDALRTLHRRDGIPVSEQIRRAIRMWLDAKGIPLRDEGDGHAANARGAARRRTRR